MYISRFSHNPERAVRVCQAAERRRERLAKPEPVKQEAAAESSPAKARDEKQLSLWG